MGIADYLVSAIPAWRRADRYECIFSDYTVARWARQY